MTVQVHYRKTQAGEWVACGPVEKLIPGCDVEVFKKYGESEFRTVKNTGSRVFQIDGVNCCYAYLEERERPAPKTSSASTPPARVPDGLHLAGTFVYKVATSKSTGNQYALGAKRQHPDKAHDDRHGLWVYLGMRPLRELSADTVLTLEQAMALGLTEGVCVVCQADLEDPISAHYGIGPTCFRKMSGLTVPQAVAAGRLPEAPAAVKMAAKARRRLHSRPAS